MSKFECPLSIQKNYLLYDQNMRSYFLFRLACPHKKVKSMGSIKKGGEQTFYALSCESRNMFPFSIKEAIEGITSNPEREMGFFNITALFIVRKESGLRWRESEYPCFGSYLSPGSGRNNGP